MPAEIEPSRISETPLDIASLLTLERFPECGGLAMFAGTVRDHHQGRAVTALCYTAHAPVCEKLIREIEAETKQRFAVPYLRVQHRIGKLAIGELALVCVARAPHRAEAFAACRYAVDAVKHRAPVWKEEFYSDGSSAFVEGCCIREDAPDIERALTQDHQQHAHHHLVAGHGRAPKY